LQNVKRQTDIMKKTATHLIFIKQDSDDMSSSIHEALFTNPIIRK
jgi:hypothetical protein